ncbi:DUF4123 domain-containing protein [Photorhabdus heterorhabditis]|uniref:DUF4123 domain-containing protein n=1 Tax=Photorhabdus heterorhabditis TaxID=880156 RepID=A0A5B0X9R9_9GAMM|nr:DUF4123 domain-containing protein [Photorhabdus heterorhabditis]KAA1195091.1 DUF4123 domain-containing protein [Photorhabdus heterorhabditis]
MAEEKRYAVIDGAAEPRLFFILEHFDPPVTCLYDESLQPELLKVAPYLVEVTEKVGLFLAEWGTPWGILLHSQADMKTLRQHLRKYLQVLLPDQAKPVFFRFYDPRNIWDFLSILSDWEIHCFLGPIDKIATNYPGIDRQDSFHAARKQFPRGASSKRKMLSITSEQLEKIQIIFTERYVHKLASCIDEWGRIEGLNYIDYSRTLFTWFRNIGITDDRSIRGLTKLFVLHKYCSIEELPVHYKTLLENDSEPGYLRAEKLLLQELGSVPL